MIWKDRFELHDEFNNLIIDLDNQRLDRCLEIIRFVASDEYGFDDERAHMMEKLLWEATLKRLAKENSFAEKALLTKKIKFDRWFA